MKKNVGGIDKVLRIILGVVLVLLELFTPLSSGMKTLLFFLAVISLFTGIFGV